MTDDGYAWVKALGNPEGPHALACDLLGTRLAAWLGLKTFDISIVEMDEPVRIRYSNGTYSSPGPAFIAREVEGRSWNGESDDIAQNVANVDHVSGLVVFDTWTRNVDRFFPRTSRRNLRNVFLSSEGAPAGQRLLLAMDHTACFRLDADLNKRISHIDNIKETSLYGLFDGFVPHVTPAQMRPFTARLRSIVRSDVEPFLYEIPREWEVTDDVRSAVQDFVLGRARFVGEHIESWLKCNEHQHPQLAFTFPGFEAHHGKA